MNPPRTKAPIKEEEALGNVAPGCGGHSSLFRAGNDVLFTGMAEYGWGGGGWNTLNILKPPT